MAWIFFFKNGCFLKKGFIHFFVPAKKGQGEEGFIYMPVF